MVSGSFSSKAPGSDGLSRHLCRMGQLPFDTVQAHWYTQVGNVDDAVPFEPNAGNPRLVSDSSFRMGQALRYPP